MSRVDIDLSGLNRIRERLPQRRERLSRRTASHALEHARQIVPIDTRELHDGLHIAKVSDTTWELRSLAPHSAVVEFGAPARNIGAQPYLRPAATLAQQYVEREGIKVIRP
jgi:hypothetical protein